MELREAANKSLLSSSSLLHPNKDDTKNRISNVDEITACPENESASRIDNTEQDISVSPSSPSNPTPTTTPTTSPTVTTTATATSPTFFDSNISSPTAPLSTQPTQTREQIILTLSPSISADTDPPGAAGYSSSVLTKGCTGLANLGNTCFMNAAIQCMSATIPLTDYFLSRKFEEEINIENPLGTQGRLTRAYADLLRRLWNPEQAVVYPLHFRSCVAYLEPRFNSHAQQDAQELLGFLLDGLHEDLNRVKEPKPFVPQSEGNGTNDEEVAEEAWQGHLKRNRSIIIDLFQGMFRSTVICDHCQRVSVTFEPFNTISLPLPPSDKLVVITVIPVNYDVRQGDSSSVLVKMPIRYGALMHRDRVFGELSDRICELSGIEKERLLFADIFDHKIYSIVADTTPIHQLQEPINLFAFEVSPSGSNIQRGLDSMDSCAVSSRGEGKSMSREYESLSNGEKEVSPQSTKRFKVDAESNPKATMNVQVIQYADQPTQFGVMKQPWGYPLMMTIFEGLTTRNLYDAIERQLRVYYPWLGQPGEEEQEEKEAEEMFWSTRESSDEDMLADPLLDEEQQNKEKHRPFVLRPLLTSKHGFILGKTDILCTDEPMTIPLGRTRSSFISIGLLWLNLSVIHRFNEIEFMSCIEHHESIEIARREKERSVSFGSCLDTFARPECIDNHSWYCDKCREFRPATKQIGIWKLPKILIVHLLRFQFTATYKDKIETVVEFPIEDLDLSRHVIGSDKETNNSHYELFGVVHHIGSLNWGHYIGWTKVHGKWWEFDDGIVKELQDPQFVSSAPYLLFYRRKETQSSTERMECDTDELQSTTKGK